jgi:peptidoglycan/LPS O-acetylase OafA/YrhL
MKRFQALDGWRGIAALGVAIFHLQVASHFYTMPLIRHAYLLVDFFFVLSGFVISHSYANRLGTLGERRSFAIKRFARVWPLHLFMLSIFVAFEIAVFAAYQWAPSLFPRPPFSEDRTIPAIVVNILLLNGVGIYDGSTWNAPSWSISAEFFTYLIFAAAFVFRKPVRDFILVALLVAAFLTMAFFAPKYLSTSSDFGLFRCLLGFVTGHFVWRLKDQFPRLGGSGVELAIVSVVVTFLILADVGPLQLAAPVIFGLVIIISANEDGVLSRLLMAKAVQKLGEWSYSIYMVHFFLAFLINNILRVAGKAFNLSTTLAGTDLVLLGNQWAMDIVTIAYALAVVAMASVTYRFIERPGMLYFSRPAPREAAVV